MCCLCCWRIKNNDTGGYVQQLSWMKVRKKKKKSSPSPPRRVRWRQPTWPGDWRPTQRPVVRSGDPNSLASNSFSSSSCRVEFIFNSRCCCPHCLPFTAQPVKCSILEADLAQTTNSEGLESNSWMLLDAIGKFPRTKKPADRLASCRAASIPGSASVSMVKNAPKPKRQVAFVAFVAAFLLASLPASVSFCLKGYVLVVVKPSVAAEIRSTLALPPNHGHWVWPVVPKWRGFSMT